MYECVFVKSDNHLLSCALAGNCDVRAVRITVHDVTMMYCQERYMENVPSLLSQFLLTPVL